MLIFSAQALFAQSIGPGGTSRNIGSAGTRGYTSTLWAQTDSSISIAISPKYGSHAFTLVDSSFQTHDTNDMQIDELKFYISQIQFLKNGRVVLAEQNSFHLVDASDRGSLHISILNKQNIAFDELEFNLGIDSATNISGVMGGDLDPTKGMYWAWQSGYINFKLEGTSRICTTRNHEFQFHLGGYQDPFQCLQTVSFTTDQRDDITLYVDIKKVLDSIDLKNLHHIMSPGKEAVLLSNRVAHAFEIQVK